MAVGDLRTDITAEQCVNTFVPGTPEGVWVLVESQLTAWAMWIGNVLFKVLDYPFFWWSITDFDGSTVYKSVDYKAGDGTPFGLESIDQAKQSAESFYTKFIKEN